MRRFTNSNQLEFLQRREGLSCIGITNRAGDDRIYVGRVPKDVVQDVLRSLNSFNGTHAERVDNAIHVIRSTFPDIQ